jgi:WD40 repeat protein
LYELAEQYDESSAVLIMQAGKIVEAVAGQSSMIYSAAFSPDGKNVLTGGRNGIARIWNLERVPPPERPAIRDF